ncbi:MAG: S-methyl-5-thioribose-1-phosphate isomerase [Candidatus Latescibacteria bacterium]|jgi:methylthioribose-1-phosphate isomerase|nr:S-methyl-5-thioribose-1-phosphate isomerase [Candidatus Latescibacterota bacterium]MBT5829693.1 S-methyl-5-thioribose-1-phosphate isomerase [Candidatus Latescibacterota bacterium]
MPVPTILWENNALRLIDQTLLPEEYIQIDCKDTPTVAEAIKSLRVRGAPAIGVSAAYGVVIAAQEAIASGKDFDTHVKDSIQTLSQTRPTAVNLFWALEIMEEVLNSTAGQLPEKRREVLLTKAHEIFEEDKRVCRKIGKNGATLLDQKATILTHCNAGGLATADYGTALAVVYAAVEAGKNVAVYADETRPLLQGSRLTAWELHQSGVDVTVICDNMAATVLRQKNIDCIVVGSDRIAANGDVANKIGTYGLAILAREHNVPFYVAAPLSTIDMNLSSGDAIPIEERNPDEVSHGMGRQTAPEGVKIYNPAFDVTPKHLVSAIITEQGVAKGNYEQTFKDWFAKT